MHLVCSSCGTTNRIPEERLSDRPACGRCATPLMAADPVSLSDGVLPKFVLSTDLPVLVDFWAAWCEPCKTMAPIVAAVAREMPEVRFAEVDSDAAPGASALYTIRSLPTLVLFNGGAELARRSGVVPTIQLVTWIQQHLRQGSG